MAVGAGPWRLGPGPWPVSRLLRFALACAGAIHVRHTVPRRALPGAAAGPSTTAAARPHRHHTHYPLHSRPSTRPAPSKHAHVTRILSVSRESHSQERGRRTTSNRPRTASDRALSLQLDGGAPPRAHPPSCPLSPSHTLCCPASAPAPARSLSLSLPLLRCATATLRRQPRPPNSPHAPSQTSWPRSRAEARSSSHSLGERWRARTVRSSSEKTGGSRCIATARTDATAC